MRLTTAVSLAILSIALPGCGEETFFAYYAPGPVQALGNDRELWIFLEIDRQVARSHRAYDAPGVYPVGHRQELLVLNVDGLKERVPLTTKDNVDGVTFHPNNALVFGDGNAVFDYGFPSRDHEESLFRWDDKQKRFVLLPLSEGKKILDRMAPSASFADRIDALEARSATSGWSLHYSDRVVSDNQFSWNGLDFTISVAEKEGGFEIKIDATGGGGGYPVSLEYATEGQDLDSAGFKSLSREEYGHPK